MSAAPGADVGLLPQHAALLTGSRLDPEVARERGYRSVVTRTDLKRLGFGERQWQVPALLIPVHTVSGEIGTYQARPDMPRVKDGKAIKYETPSGSRMVIDVPPRCRLRGWIGDASMPLFITEGSRKADAAVSIGICCIALLGVWNWRGRNEFDSLTALGDWDSIALKHRDVYICFDSDVMTKPAVHLALVRLKRFLESRGARVHIVYLPPGNGGIKVGLDDFLATGKSVADLLSLATDTVREPVDAAGDADEVSCPYYIKDGATYLAKQVGEEVIPVRLANFAAQIVSEVTIDDGASVQVEYIVEARIGSRSTKLFVPARQFASLVWTNELGASAIVSPGFGQRDHLRAAVQWLSSNVELRIIYAHTGWREIPGHGWAYLHAGGAVGPNGPVAGVEVRLPQPLLGMVLPPPPDGQDLKRAFRSVQDFLQLGPGRLMYPLQSAAIRAVIGETDFSLIESGQTDCFKTEVAVLVQAQFGLGFSARKLPGSWLGTANSIEFLAFTMKDSIFVIDDFVPTGSRQDIQRQVREMSRILRAQGNGAGRSRLSSDCSLNAAKSPRGLILSTNEELPPGHSALARALVLEFSKGDITSERLTPCQEAARDGWPARFMSAFLMWFAKRYTEIKASFLARARALRDQSQADSRHRRTASIIGDLQASFEVLMQFALETGCLDEQEAAHQRAECWRALLEVAEAQGQHHTNTEP